MASRPVEAEHDADTQHHPTERTYIQIAAILAVITGLEVAIYYIPAFSGVLVPALVALSALKFTMVIGYFMHLKDDNKMLGGIFIFAMIIALSVFIGLWFITHYDQVTQFFADMSV